MSDLTIFNGIISLIKCNDNYVPRPYQTIGGMWTVDKWQKNNIFVLVMDEGYTTEIRTLDIVITRYYNNELKGNIESLTELRKRV